MSKLTRLNSLGIYRVSNYKYIVPVKSESIGIIYGYNGNNIKKIMNKFDTTIVLKKASYNQSPYKYPSFIISSNNQIKPFSNLPFCSTFSSSTFESSSLLNTKLPALFLHTPLPPRSGIFF